MPEEQQASDNMKKFFENLLEIKQFVLEQYQKKDDPILHEIYIKLDAVIKEKQ